MTSRSFILTLFDKEILDGGWKAFHEKLWATGRCVYLNSQLELCPLTSRIHWQAFVKMVKGCRGAYFKKLLSNTLHFEPVTVERAEAIGYGIKENSRLDGPWENGVRPSVSDRSKGSAAGGKATAEKFANARAAAKKGQFNEIDDELYIKYFSNLKKIHLEEKLKEETVFPYKPFEWQTQLLERLETVDDRSIIWIYDEVGGSGKTKFAGWLGAQPGNIYITLGKKEDVLHLVGEETLILMDIARSEIDNLNYATLEKLKDGYWLSGKYEGKKVHRKSKANIVVFSNSLPNFSALSLDRWEIYNLSNKKLTFGPPVVVKKN